MMLVDAIWMGVLAWYLSQVLPSEFGTHKPWYFVFMPAYWMECFGIKKSHTVGKRVSTGPDVVETGNIQVQTVEPVPDNLTRQVNDNNHNRDNHYKN